MMIFFLIIRIEVIMGFVFDLRQVIIMVYCEWKVMFLQVDVEVHRC